MQGDLERDVAIPQLPPELVVDSIGVDPVLALAEIRVLLSLDLGGLALLLGLGLSAWLIILIHLY